MNELLAFLLTTLVSFWGSLQLGLVNVKVIQTALSDGLNQAKKVAFGGCIPEIIYAGLALFACDLINVNKQLVNNLSLIIIPVFFGLALYYFLKKPADYQSQSSKSANFTTGFILGMLNPQLLLYWTLMFFYMGRMIHIKATFPEGLVTSICLTSGAAVGAYLALRMFAGIAVLKRDLILTNFGNRIDKVIGFMFLILGTVEVVRKLI